MVGMNGKDVGPVREAGESSEGEESVRRVQRSSGRCWGRQESARQVQGPSGGCWGRQESARQVQGPSGGCWGRQESARESTGWCGVPPGTGEGVPRGQRRQLGVASDEGVFLAGGSEEVDGWWSSTVV